MKAKRVPAAKYIEGQPVFIATPGLRWAQEIFRVTKRWKDSDGQWHYTLLNLRTDHEIMDCAEHHIARFRHPGVGMKDRLRVVGGNQQLAPKVYPPLNVYRGNGTTGGDDAA